jgi:hypothetical protein
MKSVADIMEKVQELTEKGILKWDQDPMGFGAFYVDISNNRLSVRQWTDQNDGSCGITVSLNSGTDHDSMLDNIVVNEYSGKYDYFQAFFNSARRSALDVESTISDIEKQLSELSRKR